MKVINRVLCFLFFLLLVYLYIPASFGQSEAKDPKKKPEKSEKSKKKSDDMDELRKKINDLQKEMDRLKQNLPDVVKDEVDEANKKSAKKKKQDDARWRAASRQSRWTMEGGPRRKNLNGRYLVGAGEGIDSSYGVLFDIDSGANIFSKEGADRVNIYKAKITPFIRFNFWGAEMSLNIRNFLEQEVIKGELRDQISDQDLQTAYIYIRPINTKEFEVIAYVGLMNEPFVREVVDSSIFTNKSIMDKYRLNTSMALRVDLGVGRLKSEDPRRVERPLWVQAATFNLDKDNKNFHDFAVRVILSLGAINKYAKFKAVDLSGIQLWGGYAQIRSGKSTAGEADAVTDPKQTQRMTVLGAQFDLNKLTGADLGVIYGEFVNRKKTGGIKDQAFVAGYEIKINKSRIKDLFGYDLLPHISASGRAIELGLRYQYQKDDPDPKVKDGQVIQGSIFYPLTDQNIGVRLNLGYVIRSTDPERDRQFIVSVEIEVLW